MRCGKVARASRTSAPFAPPMEAVGQATKAWSARNFSSRDSGCRMTYERPRDSP